MRLHIQYETDIGIVFTLAVAHFHYQNSRMGDTYRKMI